MKFTSLPATAADFTSNLELVKTSSVSSIEYDISFFTAVSDNKFMFYEKTTFKIYVVDISVSGDKIIPVDLGTVPTGAAIIEMIEDDEFVFFNLLAETATASIYRMRKS